MLKGIWKSGSEDLSDAFDLRRHIFIEEQKVPVNLEFTGDDTEYEHLVIYDDGEAVATGRMCFVSPKRVHLGRICVKKEKRGQKIGDFLVRIMLEKAFQMGALEAELDAQEQAAPFYQKLGFVRVGPIDEPTGIPHCAMTADLLKRV